MMRSLWTAASGMSSQQMNVDTIANNLANVNTYGYKKERLEFKSLLYETMSRATLDPANTAGRPVNLQVGHGVRPIATARIFDQGSLENTGIATDFAIEGNGFFTIQRGEDDICYTKDGAFKVGIYEDEMVLTTAEGYLVLSTDEEPIVIPDDVQLNRITVNEEGTFYYLDEEDEVQELGAQLAIAQFQNPQGLEAVGSNLLKTTAASGDAILEADGDITAVSRVRQGSLELSNVQVAEEMVKLIVAQRAYELNSKAITTSDEMLQNANNLKR